MRILLALVMGAVFSTACASAIPPRQLVPLPFDREAWLKIDCGDETNQQSMNECLESRLDKLKVYSNRYSGNLPECLRTRR